MEKTESAPRQSVSRGEKAVSVIAGVVDRIFIYFFALILLFCAYAIYDSLMVYHEAELPVAVREYAEKDENDQTTAVDFDSLHAINDEIVAWVQIDDTEIDFPVTHTDNNTYYLTRSYTKDYSLAGSIYLDSRNAGNFKDDYNIIYGHNMNDEMMFGGLKKFADTGFFETHRTGRLLTPEHNYQLEIIAYVLTDRGDQKIYNTDFLREGQNATITDYLSQKSLNYIAPSENRQLLALSTCHGRDGGRVVLIASFGDEVSAPEDLPESAED